MNRIPKRLIAVLLAVLLLAGVLPVSAAAYDGRYDVNWSKITASATEHGRRAAQIAWTQVGYFENTHPDGMSGTVMAQSGSNPTHYYNKYSGGIGDWCVAFVWWCLKTSGIRESAIPSSKHVSVITQSNPTGLYTYYPCGKGYEPKLGDIAVYGWSGGGASHAELVTAVQVVNDGARNPADRALLITSIGGNTTGQYGNQRCKWGVGVHNTFLYYPNRQAQSYGDRILGIANVRYEGNLHNHNLVVQKEVAATCTQNGMTQGQYCGSCRRVLQAQTVIPAKGHIYRNGFCAACGLKSGEASLAGNPFRDVAENSFFYAPVLWAVENGVTSGTSATSFSPWANCTRGQVVTFLWRAMGEPEPTITANPFADVSEKDYYYKAVLWALEQGITSGTGPKTFAPNAPCTRGQVATFLWRTMGKPATVSTGNGFADLSAGAYYYDAVLWAVEAGVTSGVGNGRFAPEATCTRGQIVTFLYRALA